MNVISDIVAGMLGDSSAMMLALLVFRLKRYFKSNKEFEAHLAWKQS